MSEHFGTLSDGTPVHRWTLERAGTRVRILTYGGIVQSVEVPDRDGHAGDVVLGFADLAGYLDHPEPFLGALIGRYANRIAGARFTLDGREYPLAANNAPNSLHGGPAGFDKVVWAAEEAGPYGVRLSRVSPDGEEGFPGRLDISVTYALDEAGALRISYEATTDAPTVVNLTNHSYFNLAASGVATDHELRVDASRYTPVDATLIPAGEPAEVSGTRFDFRTSRKAGGGYDHNFVLDKGVTERAEEIAELHDPASGRTLTVSTTEPGIQVYTADHLSAPFAPCAGIALETQHFPDSPNRPDFPGTVLRPGEVYRSETVYGFSAR
ncbi:MULTISPECIES: aldose epimerase family protein [unclassified Streptomyces]|uniref:aldose epimerase family protein n=1 Tax=unclassified Streptomyces TaxID=2593676 RepID=UPI000DD8A24B|nr:MULTISPECIES: aldose epimerase family protein [unclassified Streptomyces]QZZ27605.1 galactose mutarotase [Streptomyces sp. ST1015]